MSTHDVPGANSANQDRLAMGAWAEHEDGSLIVVEAVEAGSVVYSIFDVAQSPPVEYRDAMPEDGFEDQFTWKATGKGSKSKTNEKWTWHDKTPFPWDRVMRDFPAGVRTVSAAEEMSAARRVAESLQLRAGEVRERHGITPTMQRAATKIMEGIAEAIGTLRR